MNHIIGCEQLFLEYLIVVDENVSSRVYFRLFTFYFELFSIKVEKLLSAAKIIKEYFLFRC